MQYVDTEHKSSFDMCEDRLCHYLTKMMKLMEVRGYLSKLRELPVSNPGRVLLVSNVKLLVAGLHSTLLV
jgi:hypothetical protein